MIKSKLIPYIGSLFMLLFGLAGCNTEGKPVSAKVATEIPSVKTAKVKKQTTAYTLSLPGNWPLLRKFSCIPK